jgi:hypothetical protein
MLSSLTSTKGFGQFDLLQNLCSEQKAITSKVVSAKSIAQWFHYYRPHGKIGTRHDRDLNFFSWFLKGIVFYVLKNH